MSLSRINIIGCGRLAKTIAALFKKNNAAIICGIVNSTFKSASDAVSFIGQGTAYKTINDLPPADIYFITTPDDTIQKTCDELASKNKLKAGSIIVHCSGALTSDVLNKAKQQNCYTASIHPMKSFANPADSINSFSGTYCAIEGDDNILSILTNLFKKIGANVFRVNKNYKKLYHVGGVLANNYLVALHHQALQCYKEAGIDEETASNIVSMLMTETLSNLKKLGHNKALTGPIQRGDTQTVQNHMNALSQHPLTQEVYASLGQATLPLTAHSADKLTALRDILTNAPNKQKLDNSPNKIKLFCKL